MANRGSTPKSDRDGLREIGFDLARSDLHLIGRVVSSIVAGGEVEAPEAEDRVGDEGDDV